MADVVSGVGSLVIFAMFSMALFYLGIQSERRRAQREQRLRVARMIAEAQAKAAQAPDKVPPRYPAASDAVRKRAQA